MTDKDSAKESAENTEEVETKGAEETVAETTEADPKTETAESDTTEESEDSGTAEETSDAPVKARRQINWSRVLAFGLLPALALLLAAAAGFLKWQDSSVRDNDAARAESMQVAKDSTAALLSYKPDTVEQQLGAARDLLTGEFRGAYTSLTTDVVIPGAKQKNITAAATVPAAASVSADPGHAVVLVFVNQTVTVGNDPPTDTASSVRVTLDKAGDRWLISKFDPV